MQLRQKIQKQSLADIRNARGLWFGCRDFVRLARTVGHHIGPHGSARNAEGTTEIGRIWKNRTCWKEPALPEGKRLFLQENLSRFREMHFPARKLNFLRGNRFCSEKTDFPSGRDVFLWENVSPAGETHFQTGKPISFRAIPFCCRKTKLPPGKRISRQENRFPSQ